MQPKESLMRVKSLIVAEKMHIEIVLLDTKEAVGMKNKEYVTGYYEGKQQLCNELLRQIDIELRDVD